MAAMNYGHRLLPHVVDEYAQDDQGKVYAAIPRSTDVSQGFEDITMREMAQMIDHMCWHIDDILCPKTSATIAYIGLADLRYPIMFLAAVKTGHKILFMSPRNTLQQNAGMLERTDCVTLFYAEEMVETASQLKTLQPEISYRPIHPFAQLRRKDPAQHRRYAFDKTFDELRDEKCLILHSSGSTGDPKLVSMTHGTIAVTDNDRYMPVPEGRRAQNGDQFNFSGGGRFYSCFPPYHLAGVQAYLIQPIFSTATVVFGHPNLPPSGYMLAEIMQHQHLRAFYVPPFVIEQWVSTPESDKQAKQLDFILFGGGPLSPVIGDALSKVTNVCQMYGALEIGQVQLLIPQPGEWAYMEFNPFEEADMQPAGEGVYEMVLHQEPKFAPHRSLSHNFPDVQTWRTGDLFAPHPTKPGLWKFDSRIDDLIVLSTGHKVRPLEMETIIQGEPSVSGVLIVGQGKPQPLLIIEAKPGSYDGDQEAFIDRIWPSVQQANSKASTYGQLTRSKILVANPDRPFKRAPKGSIIRKLTTAEYQHEIETAFAEPVTTSNEAITTGSINDFMLPGIKLFVQNCIRQVMPDMTLADGDNLFLRGLDSLRAAELGRKLRLGLAQQMKTDLAKVSLRLIYRHPTIETLATAILTIMSGQDPDEGADQTSSKTMELMVEEFTRDLKGPAETSVHEPQPSKEGLHVVLIGPRGSLGPYVIRSLLEDPRVVKVYCLARGADGRERLSSSFKDRGLSLAADEERVVCMPCDLALPNLGLSAAHYDELLSNADIVIHNAWKVDFSLTLESYKVELIRSVRELVDFGRHGARRPRITFISSISTVQEWARVYPTPVTEEPLPSYDVVSPLGYGQSKHVSERILVAASATCDMPVTILRVGQVAGPTDVSGGRWSTDEWIPSVATISKTLGAVPTDIPQIDWIPVDLMARAICESALPPLPDTTTAITTPSAASSSPPPPPLLQIYNLVNPRLSPWSTFVSVLRARIGGPARLVPLQQWVALLAQTDPAGMSAAEAASSMKILPFFQHLAETAAAGTALQPLFETGRARARSATMRGMRAVDEALVGVWCEQWGI